MAVYRSTYTWNCTLIYMFPQNMVLDFPQPTAWTTPDSIDPKDFVSDCRSLTMHGTAGFWGLTMKNHHLKPGSLEKTMKSIILF